MADATTHDAPSPRASRLLLGLLLVLGTASSACTSATARAKRDWDLVQRESTPERLTARGEAFATWGDVTRAEQYFVAALRAGGNAKRLTERLIAVTVTDNRYPAALEYAEEYLAKHPADTRIRYAAATLHLLMGDRDGARAALGLVIRAWPHDPEAHFALAQLERDRGDALAADQQFRAYLRMKPGGPHAEAARAALLQVVP